MPLLKKKEFRKTRVPDGFTDNEEVFYCPTTNEIFRDYDEFCARIILCNSMVWTCSYTGKTGLTYSEALESETNAKKLFKDFPSDLRIPVLFIASKTQRSSFHDMLEDIYGYVKDRYFIGENVEASFSDNRWHDSHILQVIAPTPETVKKAPKNGQAHYGPPATLYHYEVEQMDPEDQDLSEVMIVNYDHIRRKKKLGRDKLKLFLKQYIEINELGIFIIKPTVLDKFGIHKVRYDQIFDGSIPGFDMSKKLVKAIKNTKQASLVPFLKNGSGNTREKKPTHNVAKNKSTDSKANKKPTDDATKKKPTPNGLSENNFNLIEKMQKRQEDFEQKKEDLRQKRNEERRKLRAENLQISIMLKEWYKPKEDLELEDHKILPVPTPVRTQIPDEYMGDVFAILEFVKTFSKFLSVNNFFPGGLKLEVLERALTQKEVAGPLMDLIQMLLSALINVQVEESSQYNTKVDRSSDKKIRVYKDNPSLSEASDFATLASSWSSMHLGIPLINLPLYSLTTSEILRLHLLSAGARINDTGARWRYQYRGGYLSEDDPGLYFRVKYPHIIKALGLRCVTELPTGDILKIIDCLMSQLLTYADIRDLIEDQLETAKQAKLDYKTALMIERKQEHEYNTAKWKIKKETKENKNDSVEQLDKLDRDTEKKKSENDRKMSNLLKVANKHQTYLGQDRAFRKYIKLESIPGVFINFEEDNPGYCYDEVIQQNPDLINSGRSDILAYLRKVKNVTNTSDKENILGDSITHLNVVKSEINSNIMTEMNSNVMKGETSSSILKGETNSNVVNSEMNSSETECENNSIMSETNSNQLKSETNSNLLDSEMNSSEPKSEINPNEVTSEMDSNELKSEMDSNELNSEANSNSETNSNVPKCEMNSNEVESGMNSNELKGGMNSSILNSELNSNELKIEIVPNELNSGMDSNELKSETNSNSEINSNLPKCEMNSNELKDGLNSRVLNGEMNSKELKSEMNSDEPKGAMSSNELKSETNSNSEMNSNLQKCEMSSNELNGGLNSVILNSEMNSNELKTEMNSDELKSAMSSNGEINSNKFTNDPDKLLMCNSNPATCVVHSSTVTREKWSFLNSGEQITELVNSLNVRGMQENELKQNVVNDQEYFSKLVEKTALYFNTVPEILEENTEDGSEPKPKNNYTQGKQKYENATLGYPKELGTALILQYILVENILEIEGNLFAGNLGSIKVKDRDTWRTHLANHSYDLLDTTLKRDRKVNSKIKEISNISRPSTPDLTKEYQDPGKFLGLSVDVQLSDHTSTNCNESNLFHSDDQKLAIQTLARALAQVAEGVDSRYLKKPLGNITMRSDTKMMVSDLLDKWENSLLASTSYCQIFLHYCSLDRCVVWSRSALRAYCTVCRKKSDSEKMLLCDNCNKGQHLYCHKPKLKHVPKGNWYCNVCRKQKEAEEKLKNPPQKRRRIFVDEDTSEQSDNNAREQQIEEQVLRTRKRRKISTDVEESSEQSDLNIVNGRKRRMGKSRKKPIPIILDESSEQSDATVVNGRTRNMGKSRKKPIPIIEDSSDQSDSTIVNGRSRGKSRKKPIPIIEEDNSELSDTADHDTEIQNEEEEEEDDTESEKEDDDTESQMEENNDTNSEQSKSDAEEEQEDNELAENSEAEQNEIEASEEEQNETEASEEEIEASEDENDVTVEQEMDTTEDVDMKDEDIVESETESSPRSNIINGDETVNGDGSVIEVCEKCGVGGTLLCCDNCPDLYHLECSNPPLRRVPRGEWFCHKCKNSKKKEDTDNSRRSIRRDDLPLNNAQLQEVLAEVMKQDYAWPFLRPVNKHEVPDYYDIIENPMDFGTIKYKLNMGNYAYDGDLMSDVALVFENCKLYNNSEDEVFQCGLKMLRCFVEKAQQLGLFVPHSLVSLEVLIGEDPLSTKSGVEEMQVE